MWLNVILAKLNARQCWPAVSPRVLVQGGGGFRAGAPHGLQLSFRCQVIPHLWSLSDRSHGAFIPRPSLTLVMVSMQKVSVFPLFYSVWGARWVVATHMVVMVTLHVQLSGTCGSTILLGTTPQAHLLLMSLMINSLFCRKANSGK